MTRNGKLLLLVAVVLAIFAGRWLGGRFRTPDLVVEATPGHAAVFVDGRFLGLAGDGVTASGLAAGAHLVRVQAAGWKPVSRTVHMKGRPRRLEIALEPVPPASLSVTSEPSGAMVAVDGHARGRTPLDVTGLEPGSHRVEIAQTNYVSALRSVTLRPGASESVHARLPHRQVETYRARMEKNPAEIAVYNDLGELLYVLGRYEEAAEVFVRGLIAASEHGHASTANRHNTSKLTREMRRKHPDASFQDALNEAILRAIREGEHASLILKEFKRVPRHRYGDERLAALEGLVATRPDVPALRLMLIETYLEERNGDEFVKHVRLFLDHGTRNPHEFVALWKLLRDAHGIASPPRKKAILGLWKRSVQKAENVLRGDSYRPLYDYERARVAKIEGRADEWTSWMEKAVAAEKGTRANGWRFELASFYFSHDKLADARRHLEALLKAKKTDPAVLKGRVLMRKLKQREAEQKQPPAEAPAKPDAETTK